MEKGHRVMRYWLFKSEPDTWSWDQQVAKGAAGEEWTGVRNYQARNNMRAMAIGDRGFYYHSNVGKEIVGIVEVCATSAPDSTTDDPRWDCVTIRALCPVSRPVTLETCKVQPGLKQMALVTNTRLSVQPVTPEEWRIVCGLAGVDPDFA
jgi:predicted RNA-binding protein with PUA-like domain